MPQPTAKRTRVLRIHAVATRTTLVERQIDVRHLAQFCGRHPLPAATGTKAGLAHSAESCSDAIPSRRAYNAACVRLFKRNLLKISDKRFRTVFSLTSSAVAIS